MTSTVSGEHGGQSGAEHPMSSIESAIPNLHMRFIIVVLLYMWDTLHGFIVTSLMPNLASIDTKLPGRRAQHHRAAIDC
jgi:hypothetical protein